ncbi:hypothetical protein [Paenibacillus sp. Root444D2]|nr:hypothetical protein [Paenibacillus sp. Root444D2]
MSAVTMKFIAKVWGMSESVSVTMKNKLKVVNPMSEPLSGGYNDEIHR